MLGIRCWSSRVCVGECKGEAGTLHTVPIYRSTVDVRCATFFAAHVKHLYLDRTVPLSTVTRILSVCTGVVSFGCHHPHTDVAPLLTSLPVPLPDPSTSASTTLTQLPSLTHLAVDSFKLPYGVTLVLVVTALLAAVPHVRFLVLVRSHFRWVLQILQLCGLVDPRVHVHLGPEGDAPWHAWGWRVPDCFAVAESAATKS
ncbi:hypothetical protein FB45DRAFT_1062952 [Roridomyces roridus]|uniref:Uncharacterized protein n=1 Tax=Roridomyces roridus TaxID=1738132 RepID=A0AAD7BFR5_9AGAR|nr:hypothetical protein FB45DRAFT_1062952 [Roridomyces roridus]